jgi:hypothetical protein
MRVSTLMGAIDIADVEPRRPQPTDGMALAMDTLRDLPLNGMRYLQPEGSSGWYIWGGETMQQTADFFTAIQVRDIDDYLPNIKPFLDLPPGFRFRIDKGRKQKAWFDGSLLDV